MGRCRFFGVVGECSCMIPSENGSPVGGLRGGIRIPASRGCGPLLQPFTGGSRPGVHAGYTEYTSRRAAYPGAVGKKNKEGGDRLLVGDRRNVRKEGSENGNHAGGAPAPFPVKIEKRKNKAPIKKPLRRGDRFRLPPLPSRVGCVSGVSGTGG